MGHFEQVIHHITALKLGSNKLRTLSFQTPFNYRSSYVNYNASHLVEMLDGNLVNQQSKLSVYESFGLTINIRNKYFSNSIGEK